jgi:predicted MFS family arabinose efflux permease
MNDAIFAALLVAVFAVTAWYCYVRRIARNEFKMGQRARLWSAFLGGALVFVLTLLPGMHMCDRGEPKHVACYAGLSWFAATSLTRPGSLKRRFLTWLVIAYFVLAVLWVHLIHEDRFIGNPSSTTVTRGGNKAIALWHTPLTGIYALQHERDPQR